MKSFASGGTTMVIEAGDILQRPKGPVTHQGIALPGERVFHNAPGKGEHVTTFLEFARGKDVTVLKSDPEVRRMTLQRVQAAIKNPQKYSLLSNNCEHTVSRATKGISSSPQLTFAIFVGLLGYLLVKD